MKSLHLSRPAEAPAHTAAAGGPVDYMAIMRERNGQPVELLAPGENDLGRD